jgi:hypothetical protein
MATKLGERGGDGRTRRKGGWAMAKPRSLGAKARSEERGAIAKNIRSENEKHLEQKQKTLGARTRVNNTRSKSKEQQKQKRHE